MTTYTIWEDENSITMVPGELPPSHMNKPGNKQAVLIHTIQANTTKEAFRKMSELFKEDEYTQMSDECLITIRKHLQQLPPHVAVRDTAYLLQRCYDEIMFLRKK